LKGIEQEGFLSGLKIFAETSQQDVVLLMDIEQVSTFSLKFISHCHGGGVIFFRVAQSGFV
jgi:hypothetical protein